MGGNILQLVVSVYIFPTKPVIVSLTQMERPVPCDIDLECTTKAKDDATSQRNKINMVEGTAMATNDSQRFIPEIM